MSAYLKSVGGETDRVYAKVFLVNYDLAWNSVQESLKSVPIESADRETGSIVTQWVDNTKERNALESPDGGALYVKAQQRYIVTVSRGFIDGGGESARISVLREQLARRDILDDWKLMSSDALEEKTLLYRIARIISVRKRMAAVEEAKLKRKMQQTPAVPAAPAESDADLDGAPPPAALPETLPPEGEASATPPPPSELPAEAEAPPAEEPAPQSAPEAAPPSDDAELDE
jgi:hypothetical protein